MRFIVRESATKPNPHFFRPWGCVAESERELIGERSTEAVWVTLEDFKAPAGIWKTVRSFRKEPRIPTARKLRRLPMAGPYFIALRAAQH